MEQNRNWIPFAPAEPSAARTRPAAAPVQPAASGLTNEECIDMVLAMAYVKRQRWGDLYEPEAGLGRGTVFPALDLPFMGEGACPTRE